MKVSVNPEIKPLGDSALTVFFEDIIDRETNQLVNNFFQYLSHLKAPFIFDLIPAYRSLTIRYDTLQVLTGIESSIGAFDFMRQWAAERLKEAPDVLNENRRKLKIPVCYATSFGTDLSKMAQSYRIEIDEIISLHTATQYHVYMIGFLPGFPYMGTVPERLRFPRKATPEAVTAGSVGIAGMQTGIYPVHSPGGWQIIGKTPMKIFDKKNPEPVFFHPGDEVSFYSITEDEFKNYQGGYS
ncbi:MAG TPA: 5-oxoprolinase subunit PxpB [Flavitalea sp.]|nr:5-oxoprolinase subunit PxpB [Flavitalea sp.]